MIAADIPIIPDWNNHAEKTVSSLFYTPFGFDNLCPDY
jgi:hypothetical protein